MSRNIGEVIDAIIAEIPKDWSKRQDFLESVAIIRDSAKYTAPEVMRGRWVQLQYLLIEYCSQELPWQLEIAKIFRGDTDGANRNT